MDLGGLNPHHAAAGFGGSLASMPFMKPAGRLVAIGTVMAGLLTAMYLTPVLADILAKPAFLGSRLEARSELGLAFMIGLTSMILIPALLGAAGWVKDNIARIMERVTGTGGPK